MSISLFSRDHEERNKSKRVASFEKSETKGLVRNVGTSISWFFSNILFSARRVMKELLDVVSASKMMGT